MISVHGLYRSGTNYTRKLIEENTTLYVFHKNEYHVHTIYNFDKNLNSRRIVVYKHLNQWIESISRRCYDLQAYQDVSWEPNHTPIKSIAGVADDNFSGQHDVTLSLEKLHSLYHLYMENVEGEKFLYNDILKEPEKFLLNLNIPLKNELKLHFTKVDSSDSVDKKVLIDRYLKN